MGQLEKYGLYVLCLVIFLILGVTIWGGSDAPVPGQRTPSVAINANRTGDNGSPGQRGGRPAGTVLPGTMTNRELQPANVVANRLVNNTTAGGGDFLESLLQPTPRPAKGSNDGRGTGLGGTPIDGGRKLRGKPADANSRPQPQPAPGAATVTYTVKSGDSFDSIARRQLGSASRRTEIAKLNPRVDPLRLKIGAKLKLPTGAAGSRSPASSRDALRRAGAYRTYTIGKGDTFERIARIELGSTRRVAELKKLNPNLNPRKLRIGKKIKLPLK